MHVIFKKTAALTCVLDEAGIQEEEMERWIEIEDWEMRKRAGGGTRARVRKKKVMATAQGKYAPIIRAILKSA